MLFSLIRVPADLLLSGLDDGSATSEQAQNPALYIAPEIAVAHARLWQLSTDGSIPFPDIAKIGANI